MKIAIITLFPGYFAGPLATSLVARAIESGLLEVELVDLRQFGKGPHRQVDDSPFGGGPGMVLMIEPLAKALETRSGSWRVLLTPAGAVLNQKTLDRLAGCESLTIVCGRYEGVDERVAQHLVDEEISMGDFVLAGGEVGAAALVEGIARLLPGVVNNPGSVTSESFRDGLLEEPHYTRPADFRGWAVPEVLTSGDHERIAEWRKDQRQERTRRRRPDLDGSGSSASSGES